MSKKITPTDLQRKQVQALAGYGMTDHDIAIVVELSEAAVKRHCREELNKGRALAKSTIQQTAYNMAKSGKQPAMTMFWLKTQCQWKETTVNEHTGKDGKDLPSKIEIEFVKPNNADSNT